MQCVVVFTNRGLDRILKEGGSQAWKLDPERVRKLTYCICVQNRNDGDWGRPTHAQGEGFLIGKISGVDVNAEDRERNRYIIKFSEYAEISVPKLWQTLGSLRNPVHYLEELEDFVDVNSLDWKPVHPSAGGNPIGANSPASAERGMDIAAAKKALSDFYRVPTSNIEIVIRG